VRIARNDVAMQIPRWEYKQVLNVDDEELNKMGRQGWELVCSGGKGGNYLFFKRPIEVQEVKQEKKTYKYEEFI
jgi:hypothetical protein